MNIDYSIKIYEKLNEYDDIEIIEIKPYGVECKIFDHEVSISGEICMCHGGRLSIGVKDLGYNRIESYDYADGIEDGDQEMADNIENKMISAINEILNYKYITRKRSYYKEKVETTYHNSVQSVLNTTIGGDYEVDDVFDIEEGKISYHPNLKFNEKIETVEQIDGGIKVHVWAYMNEDGKGFIKRYDKADITEILIFRKNKFQLKKKGE